MADTDALESLAELLPPERRERFFAIASKFRDLPEDDDHLQMLEAVGFIMLVMKEIPGKIAEMLSVAQGGMDEGMATQLRSEFVEVLEQSLDTPSYKDLRETVLTIRDASNRFRQTTDQHCKLLSRSNRLLEQHNRMLPAMTTGLIAGSVGAAIFAVLMWFGATHFLQPKEKPLPEGLKPYAKLLQRGQLEYSEIHLQDYGGMVGIHTIGGDIDSAFMDGGQAVIVTRLTGSDDPKRG